MYMETLDDPTLVNYAALELMYPLFFFLGFKLNAPVVVLLECVPSFIFVFLQRFVMMGHIKATLIQLVNSNMHVIIQQTN